MFYVDRKKQMIPLKDILGMTKYYDHIFPCIIKTNLLSRYHIIAITRLWIFDGNPKHAITSNKQNINRCAGHEKPGKYFLGLHEQIQIGIKEKNRQKTNKK